jgi:hypothetical protein
MGFSVSWLAIRGKEPRMVLRELSLTETAAKEWLPESDVVGCSLASGWYVVFYNEEHAMVSVASGWQNGTQLWHIVHDSECGLSHLDTAGVLPPGFAEIRDAQRAKQDAYRGAANVDYYFDIPVEVAKLVCGFRHDDDFDEAEIEPFVVLTMQR